MNKDAYQVWLKMYKNIHKKGAFINECLTTKIFASGSGKHLGLEEEMEILSEQCARFLDKNNVRARKTKWQWQRDDVTTWPSSPLFAYAHLM